MKVINKYYYPNPAKHSKHNAPPLFNIGNIELLMEYVQSGEYLLLAEETDVPSHDVNIPIVKNIASDNGGYIFTKFNVYCSFLYKHLDTHQTINICVLEPI